MSLNARTLFMLWLIHLYMCKSETILGLVSFSTEANVGIFLNVYFSSFYEFAHRALIGLTPRGREKLAAVCR